MLTNEKEFETYEMEGRQHGPTVLVTGGIHGDEPSGWHAAHHLTNYTVAGGKVVIIPEVNEEAIQNGSHSYSDGNLNRHFPPGDEPESDLAQQLWDKVEEVDPDVYIDLHSSKGILAGSGEGIGQAVFHTPRDFKRNVKLELERFNAKEIVPSEYSSHYYFISGYTKANGPMLYHKLSRDKGIPTYLVETTRRGTDKETRTKWAARVARRLMSIHGVMR